MNPLFTQPLASDLIVQAADGGNFIKLISIVLGLITIGLMAGVWIKGGGAGKVLIPLFIGGFIIALLNRPTLIADVGNVIADFVDKLIKSV